MGQRMFVIEFGVCVVGIGLGIVGNCVGVLLPFFVYFKPNRLNSRSPRPSPSEWSTCLFQPEPEPETPCASFRASPPLLYESCQLSIAM